MACVTLKRPLDFDPLHPHHSPSASSSCSPRPHKRRKFITSSSNVVAQPISSTSSIVSPIHSLSSLYTRQSKDEITKSVNYNELKSFLQGRMEGSSSSTWTDQRASMDVEGSDVSPASSPPRTISPSMPSPPAGSLSFKDKPLFTIKQVDHLWQRMVSDRQNTVREKYNTVLAAELLDQYQRCVQFYTRQLDQRFSKHDSPSYMS